MWKEVGSQPSLAPTMPSLVLSVAVAGVQLIESKQWLWNWLSQYQRGAWRPGRAGTPNQLAPLGPLHLSRMGGQGWVSSNSKPNKADWTNLVQIWKFGPTRWRHLYCLALPQFPTCWVLALKALSAVSRCGGWIPRTRQVVQDQSWFAFPGDNQTQKTGSILQHLFNAGCREVAVLLNHPC